MAVMGQIAPHLSRFGSMLYAYRGTPKKERTDSAPCRSLGERFSKKVSIILSSQAQLMLNREVIGIKELRPENPTSS